MSEALPSLALVLNQAASLQHVTAPARVTWRELRDEAAALVPLLSAPRPGVPGLCAVCHGPAGRRTARCYQCDLHSQCAPGLLADVVLPVAFAVKGGPHARDLWQYKSARPRDAQASTAAARRLRALLLVFLRDHGPCAWLAAGRPGPTHLAVVPTGRGRADTHPLRALVAPYLGCRWAELCPRPGVHPVRDLDPARFAAAQVPGARVLLLDDTWTTGCTAQSAVLALRRSGAASVAIVVLGRHVSAGGIAGRPAMPFLAEGCAVHPDLPGGG